MSYLTEAVYEIESRDGSAYYHVTPTDTVDVRTKLDAHEYAQRRYNKSNKYNGALHIVADEKDDGSYYVMVMEE